MNTTQIECFLSAARYGSFAKSANELYVTPSAVSKHISALEQELEVILFTRTSKGAALTPAGKLMFDFFSNQNVEMSNTMRRARALAGEKYTPIVIGVPSSWNLPDMTTKIDKRIRALPAPRQYWAKVEWYDPGVLRKKLDSDELDAAICPLEVVSGLMDINVRRLTELKLELLYSVKHELGSRQSPRPEDFNGCEVFCIEPGVTALVDYERSQKACESMGVKFQPLTVPNLETAVNAISGGFTVTIVDQWNTALINPTFRHLELDESYPICICWKSSNAHPALPSLVDICSDAIAQYVED